MPDAALDPELSGTHGKDPLRSLAMQIQRLQNTDRGTLARLRRFHPLQDGMASVFETERLLQRAGIAAQGQARERWALVLHCLALAQGRHASNRGAGDVMEDIGISEARVRQLLDADPQTLADLVPRLARRLAAAGETMDWQPLADMILHAEADEARADRARRRLVEGYLRAKARRDATATDDSQG